MHPWGKWGRNFVEYGVAAARDALADAGLDWTDIQFVSGADTIRNGYPGFISGATLAQALGWSGARVSSCYAACASGAHAVNAARAQILAGLCDVALVVGADTTPKGFFAPVGGDRPDDPDWLRFRLLGATNPTYFALYARRRMALYGATDADFAQVKVKNAAPRAGQPQRPLPQGGHHRGGPRLPDRRRPPAPARDLRHQRRRRRPRALAAWTTPAAGGWGPRCGSAPCRRSPRATRTRSSRCPTSPPTRRPSPPRRRCPSATRSPPPPTRRPASAPRTSTSPRSTTCRSALELDWYENIGLCKEGEAEKLLQDGDTTLGGRIPVNPSGGLACFGEAIPAQAIAQVCELTWQLRGQATGRQVEGATVGLTVNQGLFGHGSSVIVTR